jgi:deoxycytidylate deaminase
MNKRKAIAQLFLNRGHFIVIGLTGRTGSGCTSTADILESSHPLFPSPGTVKNRGGHFYEGLDQQRYEILKTYTEQNWSPFFSIKVSDLISAYLLQLSVEELAAFIIANSQEPIEHEKVTRVLTDGLFSNSYFVRKHASIIQRITDHKSNKEFVLSEEEKTVFIKLIRHIRKFTDGFKRELKNIKNELYVAVYQAAGNSIRRIGRVEKDFDDCPFNPENVFHLPETINRIIKALRKLLERAFIVIDAIRNPYEARFFKERYSAFYLISINAPSSDRTAYLQKVHKYSLAQLNALEKVESGESSHKDASFISQNVKRCIEISDIHIFNPRNELENNNVLRAQLAWYIALMMHPGLVSPTSMERVMQIAYTAKLNSGCISRQVGAVITDLDNSIKAVGWNDVPSGQVPCSLRSLDGLLNDFDENIYSEFERNNNDFRSKAKSICRSLTASAVDLNGRNLSYCFKDIKNSVDKKGNQVHTRSLHAEENAFMQLAKYGSTGISGGKLYTTASPCELCSKKAYQLGISDVIFIDPYPGIASEHILAIGSNRPNLTQFRGAVGKGYHQLYEPTLPYKDELSYFDNKEWMKADREAELKESIDRLRSLEVLSESEYIEINSRLKKQAAP